MTVSIRQLHPHFFGEVSGVDLRKPLTPQEKARQTREAKARAKAEAELQAAMDGDGPPSSVDAAVAALTK